MKRTRNKGRVAVASLVTLWAMTFAGLAIATIWWPSVAIILPFLVLVPIVGMIVLFILGMIIALFIELWDWASE